MPDSYEYVVWLRDESLPQDDQDYEWPAAFIVVAESSEAAIRWGDRITASYAERTRQPIISSHVTLASKLDHDTSGLPVVQDRADASDAHIGW